MRYYCKLCGRFIKQIKKDVGLPLITAFPPDKPNMAATFPYAPFVCRYHSLGTIIRTTNNELERLYDFGHIEYLPVPFNF